MSDGTDSICVSCSLSFIAQKISAAKTYENGRTSYSFQQGEKALSRDKSILNHIIVRSEKAIRPTKIHETRNIALSAQLRVLGKQTSRS